MVVIFFRGAAEWIQSVEEVVVETFFGEMKGSRKGEMGCRSAWKNSSEGGVLEARGSSQLVPIGPVVKVEISTPSLPSPHTLLFHTLSRDWRAT